MQELFFTERDFLSYLSIKSFFENRLSRKAIVLYHELLRKSLIGNKDRVFISYRALEGTFKHSHQYFRAAFEELENKGYAYRETKSKAKDISVRVIKEKFCHDVEEEYQKLIIREEYQNKENHNAI